MNDIQTKKHYLLLDGLRGVAAILVIVYHVFECFPMETWLIGHGYLAVDFFFILSGFVIGYAYDDRWKDSSGIVPEIRSLTFKKFVKRRLIRLHPMVVFGVVMGTACFLLAGGTAWDGTKATTSAIMIATLMGLFLIPCVPGCIGDVRGNGEMFSLNGPHWSLFFEYLGNIMYALFIRRFTTRVLGCFVTIVGVLFAWYFISDPASYGNIGIGWTFDDNGFWGGLLRMTFSYSIGMLMCRIFKPISGASWLCPLLIIVCIAIPNMGDKIWTDAIRSCALINRLYETIGIGKVNCLYEVICVMFIFPAIVWIAASYTSTDRRYARICSFFGDISYPLYAVHYPTMYIFYAYIGFPDTWRTPGECWSVMLALIIGNILLAWLTLKFYDLPIRNWLARKI